jgi:hypothetical protein
MVTAAPAVPDCRNRRREHFREAGFISSSPTKGMHAAADAGGSLLPRIVQGSVSRKTASLAAGRSPVFT